MQGKVEISGVNTAKLKTLSNEEMMHLIELAQAGDEIPTRSASSPSERGRSG